MKIAFQVPGQQPVTLAEPKGGESGWVGPSNVRREGDRTTETKKLLGARRAYEKALGNSSGTLTFEAYKTCATVEEAEDLAAEYEDTLPYRNGVLTLGNRASDKAAIKNVVATQTGVTVHATLTISFGNTFRKIKI